MFTPEMMESVKKVEATRASRLGMEPRRMSAEEKDQLLREFHPDYRAEAFEEIKVGPNKGQKANKELVHMLHSNSRLLMTTWIFQRSIMMWMCLSSAAAEQVLPQQLRHMRQARML